MERGVKKKVVKKKSRGHTLAVLQVNLARFRILKRAKQTGYVIRNRKASCAAERLNRKTPCQYACSGRTCAESRLGVIWRVSDHDRLQPADIQFPQRHADDAGIRLAMLDIVAACGCRDKFVDVQQGKIML